ncbi:hypothetical protein [Nonomuraea typhae]|uniref:FHA domain-containing protein n=1 Tax=Nonomuraea typhae TaxID=2603600 RepID=A0ABW7Z9H3_9ACTN
MLVIQPDEGTRFPVRELPDGARLVFGRAGAAVDLPLAANLGLSRQGGSITATGDHWAISNTSSRSTYVVENPEGGGEFVKVTPGAREVPIGYGFARVVLPALGNPVSFLVWAPRDIERPVAAVPYDTRSVYDLDRGKKYFLVLVALCEPRLRIASSARIPTVPQILKRLGDPTLTRFAVNHHIRYLSVEKLRIREEPVTGKADWQRAALVNTALRFDLVTAEHLALLPP